VWVNGAPNPPVANPFSHEDRESLRLLARTGIQMGESAIVEADPAQPGRLLHLGDPERAPVEALLLAAEILGDRREVLTVELGHSSGPAALSVFQPRTRVWTASLAVAPLLRPCREPYQGVVVNVPPPDPFDAIVINIPTAEAFTFNLWATDPEAGPRPPRILDLAHVGPIVALARSYAKPGALVVLLAHVGIGRPGAGIPEASEGVLVALGAESATTAALESIRGRNALVRYPETPRRSWWSSPPTDRIVSAWRFTK
jgi:hypothetical protein